MLKQNREVSNNSDEYLRHKRSAILENNTAIPKTSNDEKHVEFFNPNLRQELEAKDEIEKRRTGLKGAAPEGDNWVWLTSYSRIPVRNI